MSTLKILLICLAVIGYLACLIGGWILAWNWIDPNSFWEVVAFLLVGGIPGHFVGLIWGLICTGWIDEN
ncbi:hypothetical protein [Bacteroides heparinolyticus]|uniref:hypothetical protein n=1 Tax=Prevotella heparinolytica TaxID=28113 RepID=UPI0023F15916|nr:hypothetical protein [Bacteroides heparinolyticus]